LIQELRSQNIPAIAIQPEGDKVTRLYANQAQFESGSVHFPKVAPWLDELISELLAFPNGRHNDQVDSISQALTWFAQKRRNLIKYVAPIIVRRPNPYNFDNHN
jgi:predicted phage terminase large subunit-like protein